MQKHGWMNLIRGLQNNNIQSLTKSYHISQLAFVDKIYSNINLLISSECTGKKQSHYLMSAAEQIFYGNKESA